jgi:hypothetical protein
MLPGKKGIMLSMEQYGAIIQLLPELENILTAKGETVPRPEYGSAMQKMEENGGAEDGDEKPQGKKSAKGNFEETSEEDN